VELKVKVEVEAGLKAATLAIYLPEVDRPLAESITLVGCGLPAKLYTLTLHKVVIADMVGVSPDRLTDAQLTAACSTAEVKAGDIVSLAGCAGLRDMSCLVSLEQMQELDISTCKSIDASTVAKVVAGNGTLSKLIFGGDTYTRNYVDVTPEPATLELGMTEADFSNKNLGVGGAIIISAWLTHKDKGALLVLSVSSNNLGVDGGKVLAEGLRGNNVITELSIAANNLTNYGQDMSGIITLADVIKDMGAMTSLNLASNGICSDGNMDGIKAISSALKVLAVILVPFLSLSDLLFNCWCLLLSSGYEGDDEPESCVE
jgi:hypothetical protein